MRSGWQKTVLGECIQAIESGVSVNSEDRAVNESEVGVLKTSCVYAGSFDCTQNKAVVSKEVSRVKCPVVKNTIIVSRMNTVDLVGASGIVLDDYPNLFLPDRLWRVTPQKNSYAPWLAYVIGSDYCKAILGNMATGTSGSMKNISQEAFCDIPILLPPLPEQRKIAAILRTWDEAIEKLEKVKQHRKKLFEQRRRSLTNIVSGHHVKLMPLSEISEEISRRNDGYDAPVMMISSTQGFIRQDENYDREMAGESLKKYIQLKKGEFAYNKGNSKTYPYGCVFRLNMDEALIPFVYICFSLSRELNASYFSHYFEAGSLNRQLVRLISSSVRGNGLLNIDSEDFFSCLIPVPDRKYQDKSAEYLDAAAKELSVLDSEIAALKNQKRGLMQKLLTGAWLVQVDKEVA